MTDTDAPERADDDTADGPRTAARRHPAWIGVLAELAGIWADDIVPAWHRAMLGPRALMDDVRGLDPDPRTGEPDTAESDVYALAGAAALALLVALGALWALAGILHALVDAIRHALTWGASAGWDGWQHAVASAASGPASTIATWLAPRAAAAGVPLQHALIIWATAGVVVWILACNPTRAGRIAWALWAGATVYMVYAGSTRLAAPVHAATAAAVLLAASLPALRYLPREPAVVVRDVHAPAPAPSPVVVRESMVVTLPPDPDPEPEPRPGLRSLPTGESPA